MLRLKMIIDGYNVFLLKKSMTLQHEKNEYMIVC